MVRQDPWTEADVRAMGRRLYAYTQMFTGDALPDRAPAAHRWLARECSRTHPDGYQASNHCRTYLAWQDCATAARQGATPCPCTRANEHSTQGASSPAKEA
jgi:hypothetical protein